MDRNLALEFIRVTEAGAIAAAAWMGRGNGKKADKAAVDEMRDRFNQINFTGKVVIGEGAKDKASQLYTGEIVGRGGNPKMDIAIDPLEATDSVAYGRTNALSVIVTGAKGSLLTGPDTYMDKIAVGAEGSKVIDLDAPPSVNIQKVAKAKGKKVSEITVVALDRPRHEKLIKQIRLAGARVRLITDGDIAGGIVTCMPDSGIDMLMGIGASAEAVLAAAPIKILGGQLLARFKPRNKKDEADIKKAGHKNINRVFNAESLAKGKQLTFTATGVIDGPLLRGVLFNRQRIITHALVIRGKSGTVRYIEAHHNRMPNRKFCPL